MRVGALMVLEGAAAVKSPPLLKDALLTAAERLPDELLEELSNELGRIPHQRLRGEVR